MVRASAGRPEDILSEAGQRLLADWRHRATNLYTAVLAGLYGLSLPFVFLKPTEIPLHQVVLTGGGIAVMVAAFGRRLPTAVRVACLMLMMYAFACVGVSRLAVGGHARVSLLVMPFMVMVLGGVRAGLAVYAVNLSLLVGLFLATQRGWIVPLYAPWRSGEWALQTVVTVSGTVPLVVLIAAFLRFLLALIRREREARARLEREVRLRERLQRDVVEAGERERRRVGRELHDGVCQDLTGVLLLCKNSQRALLRSAPAEADRLGVVVTELGDVIGEVHGLSYSLSPSRPEAAGLANLLRDLVQRLGERVDCELRFAAPERPPALPEDVTLHLYRVAQEALANALRHAGATRVVVTLARRDGDVVLTVADDGRGLPPDSEGSAGLGLRTMAWRTEQCGGRLEIGPGAAASGGGGTRVACVVPLAVEATGGTREEGEHGPADR